MKRTKKTKKQSHPHKPIICTLLADKVLVRRRSEWRRDDLLNAYLASGVLCSAAKQEEKKKSMFY